MAADTIGADVCAVVLSYNSLRTLRDVIHGILGGTVVPSRVIVVDNASIDGTQQWLQRDVPRSVEPVLMPENVGVGAGHGAGWHRALADPACRWVWSLEHDAIPAPDALERLLSTARSYRSPHRLALVRPRTYRDEAQLVARVGGHPAPASAADLIETTKTSFNGPLIPRRVLEAHGELREDFFLCLEDRDFARRLRAAGLRLVLDPSAIVWHDWGRRRRLGGSVVRSYYSTRNSIYWRRYVDTAPHEILHATAWTVASCIRTILFDDRKLDRLRARRRALVDGLRGDLGRKDYSFLTSGRVETERRFPRGAVPRVG